MPYLRAPFPLKMIISGSRLPAAVHESTTVRCLFSLFLLCVWSLILPPSWQLFKCQNRPESYPYRLPGGVQIGAHILTQQILPRKAVNPSSRLAGSCCEREVFMRRTSMCCFMKCWAHPHETTNPGLVCLCAWRSSNVTGCWLSGLLSTHVRISSLTSLG